MRAGETRDDLLWIQDAAKEYDRSVKWFQECMKEGSIKAYKIPGDRKQYLLRTDIEALLTPRPWTDEDDAGA
jgi:hypothetical protein